MTVVVDASVVVAALIDSGPHGAWATDVLRADQVAAPHLLHGEVAHVLRRTVLRTEISDDVGALAHADLLDLRMELFPYEPVGRRAWELRSNLSSYDAWYVALAEALDAPLATLDARLRDAPGVRCSFRTPP